MSTISKDAFIEAMREAVRQRGEDFVYPKEWREDGGCRYYVESPLGSTEGACIVGKAIEVATGSPYTGYNGPAHEILTAEYDLDDQGVADAAFVAQRAQDVGGTWGHALAEFERYLQANPIERGIMIESARATW